METHSQNDNAAPVPALLEYAPQMAKSDRWGKGFLAVALTFVWPGLGHAAAGRVKRGVIWFLSLIVVEIVAFGLLALKQTVVVGFSIGALSIVGAFAIYADAFRAGRLSTQPMLGKPWLRYVAGTFTLVALCFFNPFGWIMIRAGHAYRQRIAEPFHISGGSMTPTLMPGDKVYCQKSVPFDRWDLVTFDRGSGAIVNRIVGLPGETVEIVGGQININGKPIGRPTNVAPYLSLPYGGTTDSHLRGMTGAGCAMNPIHLDKDEFYLLGDNTQRALDSRVFEEEIGGHQLGAVPRDRIKGRVAVIYWPIKRLQRFR